MKIYSELSDVEKYFFLLETLWVDVNWARLLNERNNLLSMSLQDLFYLLSQEKPGYTLSLKENKEAALGLSYRLDKWKYFFLYFEWFGLWECEADQELMNAYGTKGVYFAKSIRLTTFGTKIISILLVLRNLDIWNIALRRESGELNPIPGSKLEDMIFGDIPQEFVDAIFEIMEEDQSSQPFFLPFVQLFPKETLRSSLPRSKKKFNDGIFTFKISLSNKIWRQVEGKCRSNSYTVRI
ncbi:hypothetical protein NDK43_19235 [Neobacillus pocheonensis]|uniref:Uncharacterized protein n=1 Tax=Neobacillus pocheonensis TaxID=363869 RepID=A0ABT0WCQ9_9BACI|nr:hypothetical protein [Neobacillus pocheonensis]